MKSAYPYIHRHPTTGITTADDGMTLRDFFAAKALASILYETYLFKHDNDIDDEYFKAERINEDNPDAEEEYIHHPNFYAINAATSAYAIAEAMLKARTLKYGDVTDE